MVRSRSMGEYLTQFDEVIDKSQFDRDYHFDISIPFPKDIEVMHWNVPVVFLDVDNRFHN